MTKNVGISEGGSPKGLSGVRRLLIAERSGAYSAWVPKDDRPVKPIYISENGTHLAADELMHGYTPITVNVPGGMDGVDASGAVVPAPVGGIGCSVIGIDPTTGAKTVVSVGQDGKLHKKSLPVGIRVTTRPDKTSYVSGERIIYDGLIVTLIGAGGETYTDETFPTGQIRYSSDEHLPAWERLITPTAVAPEGKGPHVPDSGSTDTQIPDGFPYPVYVQKLGTYEDSIHVSAYSSFWSQDGYANSTISFSQRNVYAAAICSEEILESGKSYDKLLVIFAANNMLADPEIKNTEYTGTLSSRIANVSSTRLRYDVTINGKTAEVLAYTRKALTDSTIHYNEYKVAQTSAPRTVVTSGMFNRVNNSNDAILEIGWNMVHNRRESSTERLKVMWESPYDGKAYEDSFEIDVREA